MPSTLENPQIEHYFYIHNVFGHFFHNTLEYFSTYLYPRFIYKVVGTYDKAVEYLQKTAQYEREVDKPNLPALILNPSGEFLPSDKGGKQFWRYPNLQGGFVGRIFDPIYKDENVMISPGFSRIKGEMELIILPSSFYEYCDLRMYLIQLFGGLERPIYPFVFTTYIIMPNEFMGYRYHGDSGFNYNLDWSNSPVSEELVKTLNRNLNAFPCQIKPWLTLTGISEGSERYGGTDKLAEWRISVSLEYEIEIPSFLVLITDYLLKRIKIHIQTANLFENSEFVAPERITSVELFLSYPNLDTTSTPNLNIVSNIDPADVIESSSDIYEYHLETKHLYIVTQLDYSSIENIIITLPDEIENLDLLIVSCKMGRLHIGYHFDVSIELRTITIYREHIYENIEIGDVYEIFEYKEIV